MYIITSLLIHYTWSNWPVGSPARINMHHDRIVNTVDLAELTARVSWLTLEPSRRTLVLKGVHVMSGIAQFFFTQKRKNLSLIKLGNCALPLSIVHCALLNLGQVVLSFSYVSAVSVVLGSTQQVNIYLQDVENRSFNSISSWLVLHIYTHIHF